jgi:hypothetical protein
MRATMDHHLLFVLIRCPDSIRASSNMAYLEKPMLDTKSPPIRGCARPLPPGSSRGVHEFQRRLGLRLLGYRHLKTGELFPEKS